MMKGNNNTIMVGMTTGSSTKVAQNIVRELLNKNLVRLGIEVLFSTFYSWNEKMFKLNNVKYE